jgi:hypothetical protein
VKYHPNVSPFTLTTVKDHIREYPDYWELMKWYICWRKVPYPTEIIAALIAEERSDGYSHYPCPMDPDHWHIGRGGGRQTNKAKRFQQAKRVFRKAVRDEIWRNHVRKTEEAAGERRSA